MVKVKICRIRDADTAARVEALGADYIGVHMLNRHDLEKIDLYKSIARVLKHAQPVIVTKVRDPIVILRIIAKLSPPYVQLHEKWSRRQLLELVEKIRETQYQTKIIGVIGLDETKYVRLVDEYSDICDYILFDRWEGGTGRPLDENILKQATKRARDYNIPFFIAGGLDPDNVRDYVSKYRPYGVDAQSGVEIPGTHGAKDFTKVKLFIEMAKGDE